MLSGFVYEPDASAACDEAEQKWTRADLQIEIVEWTITHDKACGKALNEAGTVRSYTLDGARSNDTPTVIVLYEIQGDLIRVHDMKFEEAPHAYAGRA